MDKHWTLTIQLHEVTPADFVRNASGYVEKSSGIGGGPLKSDRKVVERLTFSVSADTEEEAYSRATQILEVNRPQSQTVELRSWDSIDPVARRVLAPDDDGAPQD